MAGPLLPIMMGIQGLAGLWGAMGQNKQNKQMAQRQGRIDQTAFGMMGQGPSSIEQQLMQFLNSGFDPAQFTGEGFNSGQDALMQTLRSPDIDTSALFESWRPMEQQMMGDSLNNFWGTQSGLGQRFGSSAARETGRIRGQAADQAIGRRAETSYQAAEAGADRRLGAAQQLSQTGTNLAQQALQAWMGKAQGMQGLAGMANQRQSMDMQLLGMLMGFQPQGGANAMPGAVGDFSQMMMMLPFLQQLMGGQTQQQTGARQMIGGLPSAAFPG